MIICAEIGYNGLMKKVGILRKAVSVSGSAVRVLIGAGAIVLFVFGLMNKSRKKAENTGPRTIS